MRRERAGGEKPSTLPQPLVTHLLYFIYDYSYWPKLPYFPILYVWTERHIPFRYFTGIGVYRKKPQGGFPVRL